jgi:predicted PurR-regulated permease PerM
MSEQQQNLLTESRKWMALALLLLSGWVMYLLAPVLSPFVAGAVLAYLGDPLVDRLEDRGVNRTIGVSLIFVLFTTLAVLAILLLIPMVQKQVVIAYETIPEFIAWINSTAFPWLQANLGLSVDRLEPEALMATLESNVGEASSILTSVLKSIGSSTMAFVLWITNLVLIPVVAFYLMRDWDVMVKNIQDLLPRGRVSMASTLASEMDEVLGHFLRGQLLVMLSLGLIYSVGLWVVGLNVALVVGMIAGLASVVPYLGFIIGIVSAIVAALVQFGDITSLIGVVIVFGIGQALESMVLTPMLVGDKIGLHPVAVIFAIMAGGQLFGFVGVLVALPVAAMIMVLLRHVHSRYKSSSVYGVDATLEITDQPELEEELKRTEDSSGSDSELEPQDGKS